MDGRIKKRLGLALLVLVTLVAAPSMGDQKVSLFNPFTLEIKTVVAADSTPSVVLNDLLLLGGPVGSTLSDGDPRPTMTLRGIEIRFPQRPNLRSSHSRFPPFAASTW